MGAQVALVALLLVAVVALDVPQAVQQVVLIRAEIIALALATVIALVHVMAWLQL